RSLPVKILDAVKSIAAGANLSTAIKNDGTIWTWGVGDAGLQGPGFSGSSQPYPQQNFYLRDAIHISVGSTHAVAVSSDFHAVAWGDNSHQQLGIAHVLLNPTPAQVHDPFAPYANA